MFHRVNNRKTLRLNFFNIELVTSKTKTVDLKYVHIIEVHKLLTIS